MAQTRPLWAPPFQSKLNLYSLLPLWAKIQQTRTGCMYPLVQFPNCSRTIRPPRGNNNCVKVLGFSTRFRYMNAGTWDMSKKVWELSCTQKDKTSINYIPEYKDHSPSVWSFGEADLSWVWLFPLSETQVYFLLKHPAYVSPLPYMQFQFSCHTITLFQASRLIHV